MNITCCCCIFSTSNTCCWWWWRDKQFNFRSSSSLAGLCADDKNSILLAAWRLHLLCCTLRRQRHIRDEAILQRQPLYSCRRCLQEYFTSFSHEDRRPRLCLPDGSFRADKAVNGEFTFLLETIVSVDSSFTLRSCSGSCAVRYGWRASGPDFVMLLATQRCHAETLRKFESFVGALCGFAVRSPAADWLDFDRCVRIHVLLPFLLMGGYLLLIILIQWFPFSQPRLFVAAFIKRESTCTRVGAAFYLCLFLLLYSCRPILLSFPFSFHSSEQDRSERADGWENRLVSTQQNFHFSLPADDRRKRH